MLSTLRARRPVSGPPGRLPPTMVGFSQVLELSEFLPAYGLYLLLALGGVGVWASLPRRGLNPRALGGLVAASAGGLLILILSVRAVSAGEGLPNLFFYIFSIIALGASLRVISHPRPVYAALYFILTILSSAGMYLILSAEFMAFALVIVYAGAILITYLFVIMLATQAPSAEEPEALAEYDRVAREPLAATGVGFVLLALLTTMMFSGAAELKPIGPRTPDSTVASMLPGRQLDEIRQSDLLSGVEKPPPDRIESVHERTVEVSRDGIHEVVAKPPGFDAVSNVEGVGWNLLKEHPGSIEIAGVILLMAMLGAVVLARKKVEAEEAEKAAQARRLHSGGIG